MKENILFHWDDLDYLLPVNSKAEDMLSAAPHEEENQEDIKTRIARLSGRRPPLKDNGLGAKEDRARAFDAGKFKFLTTAQQQNS